MHHEAMEFIRENAILVGALIMLIHVIPVALLGAVGLSTKHRPD